MTRIERLSLGPSLVFSRIRFSFCFLAMLSFISSKRVKVLRIPSKWRIFHVRVWKHHFIYFFTLFIKVFNVFGYKKSTFSLKNQTFAVEIEVEILSPHNSVYPDMSRHKFELRFCFRQKSLKVLLSTFKRLLTLSSLHSWIRVERIPTPSISWIMLTSEL